jgi:replicative DNA helicase
MNKLNSDIGKQSPNNAELEGPVLGAMMLENECVAPILEFLTPECFYRPEHVQIFSAIISIFKRQEPIDIMTVTLELKRGGKLDIVGGAYYVTQLTNRVASSANAEFHARVILQSFIRRKLISVSISAIDESYDENNDVLDVLDQFISEGKKVYDHILFGKMHSTDELLIELMDDMNQKKLNGYSTGIKSIDDYIVCLEKGLKYTIAGRPGQGKTSLAKTIACNLINQGIPGIVFSMEVTAKQFMTTIVSGVCEIDSERIRKKELTETEKQSILSKMKSFKKELLIIDDRNNISESYILKRVKKAIKTHNIEWFMVDYTQLGRSDLKNRSKEERISEFTQGIKNVAKSENVIAIELAQLVKSSGSFGKGDKESKRPQISDIRDSGMIEASADCVMLLYRPESYGFETVHGESSKGMAEVIVGKNRQGRIGSCLTHFMPEYTKFIDRLQVQHTVYINAQDSQYDF